MKKRSTDDGHEGDLRLLPVVLPTYRAVRMRGQIARVAGFPSVESGQGVREPWGRSS